MFKFRNVTYTADTYVLAPTVQNSEAIFKILKIYLVDEKEIMLHVIQCEQIGRHPVLNYVKLKSTSTMHQCYRPFDSVQFKLCTLTIDGEPDTLLVVFSICTANGGPNE